MAKVNTNISLDPELKKEAVELFSSFGLDLSTAIALFLSQSVREGKIPFEIKLVPNKVTRAAIEEAEHMELHPEESETFHDLKALMKDLKK
jgi:DNA-damage-inducible protein J